MTAIVALFKVATMKNAKHQAKLFVRDTSGATAIEYGLIAGIMGLMLIPALSVFTSSSSGLFYVTLGLFDTIQE